MRRPSTGLGPSRLPAVAPSSGLERILIRLPNWLGDLLLARPLLHALKAAYPRAELCGVAPAPLLELISADGALDRLEPWPAAAPERVALVSRLAAWRPDAALVLPPSFSSALLALRAGARIRVGYGSEGRGMLLTERRPRPARGEVHLSEEYLALGRLLGAGPVGTPPPLALPAGAAAAADALLQGTPAGQDGATLAVLGPGAIYGPAKRWAPSRFSELGRRLAARGLHVLVCGAAAEEPLCRELADSIGGAATSLAGRSSLAAQAALCARARLSVCNDSGLAHLSAAVGAPTVVLFGSTSSAWSAPLGERVRVVQHAPVCSPCFRRTCSIGYRCLEAIGVAEVDRVCREIAA